jgi:hypothetical protein
LAEANNNYPKPVVLVDGNKIRYSKLGKSATIWQYTLATLSSLNYSVIGQSKHGYEATIKIDEHTYVLNSPLLAKPITSLYLIR